MFGYVLPLKEELKVREWDLFKSYYCGLCIHIKKAFGNLPRMALNYDMTFLALVLDSLESSSNSLQYKSCFVHPLKKRGMLLNNKALDYAANMNVALVYYKVLDDCSDEPHLKTHLLAKGLSPYQKKFSPSVLEVTQTIEHFLKELHHLETTKNFSSLDEICHPFAALTGEIFKAYSSLHAEKLFSFGYALGKWIYLIDALDDLKKDMEKNNFNPLHTLFYEEGLSSQAFFEQVKKRASFTLLNCGYQCMQTLQELPLQKNKELLMNIVQLGMMDKYMSVLQKNKIPLERSLVNEH